MPKQLPGNSTAELQTKLAGRSELVVVNEHLRYRRDEVQLPNGRRGLYTYIDDDYAAAATVPMANINGKRSIFLIFQERYPSQTKAGKFLLVVQKRARHNLMLHSVS